MMPKPGRRRGAIREQLEDIQDFRVSRGSSADPAGPRRPPPPRRRFTETSRSLPTFTRRRGHPIPPIAATPPVRTTCPLLPASPAPVLRSPHRPTITHRRPRALPLATPPARSPRAFALPTPPARSPRIRPGNHAGEGEVATGAWESGVDIWFSAIHKAPHPIAIRQPGCRFLREPQVTAISRRFTGCDACDRAGRGRDR
jgi:hypothetical protein